MYESFFRLIHKPYSTRFSSRKLALSTFIIFPEDLVTLPGWVVMSWSRNQMSLGKNLFYSISGGSRWLLISKGGSRRYLRGIPGCPRKKKSRIRFNGVGLSWALDYLWEWRCVLEQLCVNLKRNQSDLNEVVIMIDSSVMMLKVLMCEELRRIGRMWTTEYRGSRAVAPSRVYFIQRHSLRVSLR